MHFSKTAIIIYQLTRRDITEDLNIPQQICENAKSLIGGRLLWVHLTMHFYDLPYASLNVQNNRELVTGTRLGRTT
jgi:hypothetical protein